MAEWIPMDKRARLPVVGYLRTVKEKLDVAIDMVLQRDIQKLGTLKKILELHRGR